MLSEKTWGLSPMPWTEKNLSAQANTKSKSRTTDALKPEVFGELAALTVLNIVFAAVGPRTRRRLAAPLRRQIEDWTRGDPEDDTPAQSAMRQSALRFGRPALDLLTQDSPPPDIDRA